MDGQNLWTGRGRGEGLRNTTSLLGKSGLGHGLLFWSANSDELQDSEGGIRTFNLGEGFIEDDVFAVGTRSKKIGRPHCGS